MNTRRALAWALCIVACGLRSLDSRLSEQDDETKRRAWEAARSGGPPAPDYLDAKRDYLRGHLEQIRLAPNGSGASAAAGTVRWRNLGPFDAAAAPWLDSGRLRTIVTHPTDSRIIYLGTAGGGVWKTSNADLSPGSTWTWTPITDGIAPASASGNIAVGSLAMSPADPETLYLALGDPGGGSGSARGFFITHDGGATWSAGGDPGQTGFVYTVLPIGASVVLVGGSDGLWRSNDGGRSFSRIAFAGRSDWGDFIYSLARFADGTLLCARAGSGGIERSTDDGQTWTVAPLPQNPPLNRITLAVSGATAFAIAADNLSRLQSGVFKSTDQGKSWVWMPSEATVFPYPQGGYNQMLAVDPDDPSRILAGGIYPMRSQDGGLHWERLQSIIHADLQTAAWSRTGRKALFIGHDGGLTLLRDPWGTQGPDFADSSYNRGLATHLVYQLSGTTAATPPDARDRVAVGLQDNGCRERHGAPLAQSGKFDLQAGGDGYGVLYHPLDGSKLLCGANGWINLFVNGNYGGPVFQNAQFMPPLFADESDPSGDSAFTLSNDSVVKTTDFGKTWTTLPRTGLPAGLIPYGFASSRAPGGPLMVIIGGSGYRSLDGGATWTAFSSPANGWLSGLAFGDKTLYAWSGILDTKRPHAWRSSDLGDSWQAIDGGGLPPLPVWRLVPDRKDPAILWAATDVGVYRSADGGAAWSRFGVDLPWVTVRDLYLAADGSLVRAGTFGRGVWEARLDEFSLSLSTQSVVLAPGGSAVVQVGTQLVSGLAQPIALVAEGLPTGVTASFTPAQVSTGGGSVLTLRAAPGAAAANANCSVRASSATAVHAAALELAVAALPSPTATIAAPTASATVSGTVTVSATAAVAPGTSLARLSILVDGAPIGSGTASPASASWDTTGVANGEHVLSALAVDATGAAGRADIRVTVHNEARPPQTSLDVGVSAPADGATIAGPVRLVATATAPAGLALLELLVDGVVVASSSSSPLETSWDASGATPGSHAITAAATDHNGQRAVSAKVSVVVAAPAGKGRAQGGCSSTGGTLQGALVALLLGFVSRRRRPR